jgi:Spy/CpxP family protein refolding chaperone
MVFVGNTFAESGRGFQKGNMIKKLNLTTDQKDKIGSFREKFQKTMIDLKADLQKAMVDKREIVRKGNIDRKAYLTIEEKITGIKAKMKSEMDNHKMDIYSVLTDEQKQKVEKSRFFMDGPRKMHGRTWGGDRPQMNRHEGRRGPQEADKK